MHLKRTHLQEFLDFAKAIAWEAGRSTLGHFERHLAVESKSDDSPVTAADREAEQIMRRAIAARYPGHDIVGEEYADVARGARYRWVLDPIDGTRSYIHGVPLYATLVGLEVDGLVEGGAAYFPALDDMIAAASGLGCRWNGRSVRVSETKCLDQALLVYTDTAEIDGRRPGAWARLVSATRLQRGHADAYGAFMVATGRADVALDGVMRPWDCAALMVILREAGGRFTDWRGDPTIAGGCGVSTNGILHGPMLDLLSEPHRVA